MENSDPNRQIKVSFLLLSGGIGKRSGAGIPKQFYQISGRPLIAYSLLAARELTEIAEIIVNSPKGHEQETVDILSLYAPGIPVKIVSAGDERQDSVKLLCDAARFDTVILHEAARPMITPSMIRALLAHPHDNVGYCAPISFSMCKVDLINKEITASVNRADTQNIQLPQKFARNTLKSAHAKAVRNNEVFTEDAILCMSMLGSSVYYLDGPVNNIKVTTPEDFRIARQFLQNE